MKNVKVGTSYLAVVGQILIHHRQEMGLNQGKMAERMALSQSAWSRIEKGEAAITLDQLRQAADILKIPAADIVAAADQATKALKKQGVHVAPGRLVEKKFDGVAVIGALALGLLLARVLSR